MLIIGTLTGSVDDGTANISEGIKLGIFELTVGIDDGLILGLV